MTQQSCTSITEEGGIAVEGYEIRWGRPEIGAASDQISGGSVAWLLLEDAVGGADVDVDPLSPEGCVSADGRVRGTSLHGILDSDPLRHSLIEEIATARGRDFTPSPTPYATALDAHLDHLADWVEAHLDVPALLALAATAEPVGRAPGW